MDLLCFNFLFCANLPWCLQMKMGLIIQQSMQTKWMYRCFRQQTIACPREENERRETWRSCRVCGINMGLYQNVMLFMIWLLSVLQLHRHKYSSVQHWETSGRARRGVGLAEVESNVRRGLCNRDFWSLFLHLFIYPFFFFLVSSVMFLASWLEIHESVEFGPGCPGWLV